MNVLFVADPHASLKPLGDTTLALARECLRVGDTVLWVTPDRVEHVGHEVLIEPERIVECRKDLLPRAEPDRRRRLDEIDLLFIRKDPPFDVSYVRLCWLLALYESRVTMVNRPSLLLRYHEKLLPLEAVAQGFLRSGDLIPTFIGPPSHAKAWARENGFDPVIVKPFLGYGGRNISRFSAEEFQRLPEGTEESIVQPYRRQIETRGDRRVIYLGGKVLAHFARLPQPGHFVSNLAQGGTAAKSEMLAEEADAASRLGKFLASAGIVFAGADLIGPYVSEVNVTSPTGLRSLEKLDGTDYAEAIIALSRSAASRKR